MCVCRIDLEWRSLSHRSEPLSRRIKRLRTLLTSTFRPFLFFFFLLSSRPLPPLPHDPTRDHVRGSFSYLLLLFFSFCVFKRASVFLLLLLLHFIRSFATKRLDDMHATAFKDGDRLFAHNLTALPVFFGNFGLSREMYSNNSLYKR